MGNKLTQKEINKIIENHQHWLKKDVDDWESMKADFFNQDLSDADIHYANLSDANLCDANLCYANLRHANLRHANLCFVNLNYAKLCNANLSDAGLRSANLSNANLSDTKNMMYIIPMACPEEGSFIGFKKAVYADKYYIVKLKIPADALRSSATSRKCRCNKAKVLEIQNIDGSKANIDVVHSTYDSSFQYKTGQIIEEPKYDKNRFNECSKGIHFFINRQEAVNY